MKRTLYHGTSSTLAERIYRDNTLRCAPYGDAHVSLTTAFSVAWYFADLAARGDFGGLPVVIALDAQKLRDADYELHPFVSKCWADCEWEKEIAVLVDIHPLSDVLRETVPPVPRP